MPRLWNAGRLLGGTPVEMSAGEDAGAHLTTMSLEEFLQHLRSEDLAFALRRLGLVAPGTKAVRIDRLLQAAEQRESQGANGILAVVEVMREDDLSRLFRRLGHDTGKQEDMVERIDDQIEVVRRDEGNEASKRIVRNGYGVIVADGRRLRDRPHCYCVTCRKWRPLRRQDAADAGDNICFYCGSRALRAGVPWHPDGDYGEHKCEGETPVMGSCWRCRKRQPMLGSTSCIVIGAPAIEGNCNSCADKIIRIGRGPGARERTVEEPNSQPNITSDMGYCIRCRSWRPMDDIGPVISRRSPSAGLGGYCLQCGSQIIRLGPVFEIGGLVAPSGPARDLTFETLLTEFRSKDIADSLRQLGSTSLSSSNKDVRVYSLLNAGDERAGVGPWPVVQLLRTFTEDALGRVCERIGVETDSRGKMAERLAERIDFIRWTDKVRCMAPEDSNRPAPQAPFRGHEANQSGREAPVVRNNLGDMSTYQPDRPSSRGPLIWTLIIAAAVIAFVFGVYGLDSVWTYLWLATIVAITTPVAVFLFASHESHTEDAAFVGVLNELVLGAEVTLTSSQVGRAMGGSLGTRRKGLGRPIHRYLRDVRKQRGNGATEYVVTRKQVDCLLKMYPPVDEPSRNLSAAPMAVVSVLLYVPAGAFVLGLAGALALIVACFVTAPEPKSCFQLFDIDSYEYVECIESKYDTFGGKEGRE